MQSNKVGVAVLAEARFPTGKEEDLLGSGAFSARGLGVLSMRFGEFSPHANVGYVFRDDTLATNGVLATLGFDHLLGSWATLAVDWISEWQVGESKVRIPEPLVFQSPYARIVPVSAIQPEGQPHGAVDRLQVHHQPGHDHDRERALPAA
jgi:hypothetical protein